MVKIQIPNSALEVMARAAAEVFETSPVFPPPVYLAGPLPLAKDAPEIGREIKKLCWQYGLQGLWPCERYLYHPGDRIGGIELDLAEILRQSLFADLKEAAAVVADISPMRGPQMDALTAFVIGLAVAWEKPVFAWTSATAPASQRVGHRRPWLFFERVFAWSKGAATVARDGHWRDDEGDLIENLELVETAPIICSIEPVFCSAEEAIRNCADYLRREDQAAEQAHA